MLSITYNPKHSRPVSKPSEYGLALNEVADPIVMLLIISNIASIYILDSNKSNKYLILLLNNVVTIYLSNLMAIKQSKDLN